MKLETTITPREEGNVLVELDGKEYNFVPDESGALVADVEDEKHVAHLLNLETFVPLNEADFLKAANLANAGNADEDEDEDDDDETPDPNAAPVEGVAADGSAGGANAAPIEQPASAVAAAPAKPVAAKAGKKK